MQPIPVAEPIGQGTSGYRVRVPLSFSLDRE